MLRVYQFVGSLGFFLLSLFYSLTFSHFLSLSLSFFLSFFLSFSLSLSLSLSHSLLIHFEFFFISSILSFSFSPSSCYILFWINVSDDHLECDSFQVRHVSDPRRLGHLSQGLCPHPQPDRDHAGDQREGRPDRRDRAS